MGKQRPFPIEGEQDWKATPSKGEIGFEEFEGGFEDEEAAAET